MSTTIFLAGGAVQVVNSAITVDTAKEIVGASYRGMSKEANQLHPEENPLEDGIVPAKVKAARKQALKEAKAQYRSDMRTHLGPNWKKSGLSNVPGRIAGYN